MYSVGVGIGKMQLFGDGERAKRRGMGRTHSTLAINMQATQATAAETERRLRRMVGGLEIVGLNGFYNKKTSTTRIESGFHTVYRPR